MCNFVPGQAIAIGPLPALRELGANLPGRLGAPVLLVGEGQLRNAEGELAALASVTLHTDPGLEFLAVSRLSGALSDAVRNGKAVVDVNHILPLTAPVASPATLAFSKVGAREVDIVRRVLRQELHEEGPALRVAILDSGLRENHLAQRDVDYHDYGDAGRRQAGAGWQDPVGHGTRVFSILDEILPRSVALSVGRLPAASAQLTALAVAQALADLIARDAPDVVNLSVCLQSDVMRCPACQKIMPLASFSSSFLPLVIRLGGSSQAATVTVMAAGNTGLAPNSRWLTEDVRSLIFALAENRHGELARYSSVPKGPRADLFSVAAFGGDDPDEQRAQGVFADGAHGTSFAAPFVSALALLAKSRQVVDFVSDDGAFGDFMRHVLAVGRMRHGAGYQRRR